MSSRTQGTLGRTPGNKNLGAENVEKLRETLASGLDEEKAGQALDLVLNRVRLDHGALLAYDDDRQSLALLAERGLADEARKAITLIRRGEPGTWDMPLHALLQRRVYMIEKPRENPFVPTLLESRAQELLTNLVFLPLYSAGSARGLLLLIGTAGRVIHELDIVSLRDPSKLLGAALAKMEHPEDATPAPSGSTSARPTSSPPAVQERAQLETRIAELEALVRSPQREPAPPAASPENDRKLTELAHERDLLEAERSAREIEVANLRSEYDLLKQRNTQDGERSRKLAAELIEAREQLATVAERDRQSGQQRESMDRSRAEVEASLEGLERRLAKSMEHASEAQAEQATLSIRNAEVEARSEEMRKQLQSRDSQVADLREERDRLSSALESATSRASETDDLAGSHRAAEERASTLERRLEEVTHERGEIDSETAALRGELASAREREETLGTQLRELAREQLEISHAGDQAAAERDAGARQASELTTRLDTLESELMEARTMIERAETAERDARAGLEGQLDELRSELETSQARESRLTEELESHRRAAEDLRADNAELQRELQQQHDRLRTDGEERLHLNQRMREIVDVLRSASGQPDGDDSDALSMLRGTLERTEQARQDAKSSVDRLEASLTAERAAREKTTAQIESDRATISELSTQVDAFERRLHQAESEAGSAAARVEEVSLELAAANETSERLTRDLGQRTAEVEEKTDEIRRRDAETAEARAGERSTAEKLGAEVDGLRSQVATLEQAFRISEASEKRWQEMNEKLQRGVEQRDRDLTGLRGVIAAMRTARGFPEDGIPAFDAPGSPRPPAAAPEGKPTTPDRPIVELTTPAAPTRHVAIFDDPGPALDALRSTCEKAGFEPVVANGSGVQETPELVAVNLLAPESAGLGAIRFAADDAHMRGRPIVLYAARAGSKNGLMIAHADCLIQPVEEQAFLQSLGSLIGNGKRITIIGEELDSVLRFNGWATRKGCSVSSAGDLKQGSDLLDIVRPDLIVFDFSRLSAESASLITKVRRSKRLATLPILFLLPEESPSAVRFLERLGTLAEAAPFDPAPLGGQLKAIASTVSPK